MCCCIQGRPSHGGNEAEIFMISILGGNKFFPILGGGRNCSNERLGNVFRWKYTSVISTPEQICSISYGDDLVDTICPIQFEDVPPATSSCPEAVKYNIGPTGNPVTS